MVVVLELGIFFGGLAYYSFLLGLGMMLFIWLDGGGMVLIRLIQWLFCLGM